MRPVSSGRRLIDPHGFGFASTFAGSRPIGSLSIVTNNHGWYIRLENGGTGSKIGLHVGTQSGNISAAAYRNSGVGRASVPGTQLATTGAIACPAAGYRELDLGATITVYPGDWLALSCDNTTALFWNAVSSGGGSDLFAGLAYLQASAHPLPATPASLSASNVRAPALVLVP